MNVIHNVWVAAPFLIVLGAIGGYLVVPMNALLQHRGHNLMGAGRSIAVQNFNEQACILGLGAFYTGMTRFGLSVFGAITIFGVLVAGTMWLIRRWHRRNLRAAPRRGRAPAGDRAQRQALTAVARRALRAPGRARPDRQRLRLGRVVVAVPPPAGAGPAPAVGHGADLRARGARHRRPGGRARSARCCATPALWLIFARLRATNATFNWAVEIGDVVRVVLLFYLMPLWAVLLARVLLDEQLTRAAALRVAMALVGAAMVLWPAEPRPAPGWRRGCRCRDARRLARRPRRLVVRAQQRDAAARGARPEEGRALAMFVGGAVVGGALAPTLSRGRRERSPPRVAGAWLLWAGGPGRRLPGRQPGLQYGAARLSAAGPRS